MLRTWLPMWLQSPYAGLQHRCPCETNSCAKASWPATRLHHVTVQGVDYAVKPARASLGDRVEIKVEAQAASEEAALAALSPDGLLPEYRWASAAADARKSKIAPPTRRSILQPLPQPTCMTSDILAQFDTRSNFVRSAWPWAVGAHTQA